MKKDIYTNQLADIKILESVNIKIDSVKISPSHYKIVFMDPYCNVFDKQYTEGQRIYLREQLPFEFFKAHTLIAQRILNKNYK